MLEGVSFKELAAQFGTTEQTMRKRASRALDHVRRAMLAHLAEEHAHAAIDHIDIQRVTGLTPGEYLET